MPIRVTGIYRYPEMPDLTVGFPGGFPGGGDGRLVPVNMWRKSSLVAPGTISAGDVVEITA